MIVIPAHNPSEWTGPTGNNTYLLRGSACALIDAGVGHPDHLDDVAKALAGLPLARLLITHGHKDHASGVPAIAARWPAVRVMGAPELAAMHHAFISLLDGIEIEAGDTRLRAIHTPGHCPDHFGFFDAASGDLYCGDLARAGGTIVIPGTKGGRLADYLASLRRVRDLGPRRLLPGHGPAIDDPASLIDEYLRHRARRESEVLDALRAGCTTVDEIVPRVYGRLSPAIAPAAAESVLAHLVKLIEDRTVKQDGSHFTVV